jgi:hypothetical protein
MAQQPGRHVTLTRAGAWHNPALGRDIACDVERNPLEVLRAMSACAPTFVIAATTWWVIQGG